MGIAIGLLTGVTAAFGIAILHFLLASFVHTLISKGEEPWE